ncbi:MAG: toxin-antitoxin system HicB family antitoxin [Anaerolineae bacterium]
MGRLTLRLPDTLHQQLASLAEGEGVSLNQLIVYALTRHVTWASSARQQEVTYAALLKSLGEASPDEVRAVLNERKAVYPEPVLTADVIERLHERFLEAEQTEEAETASRGHLTVGEFRESGLIGLWKDRTDIEDSAVYARQLREQARPYEK